MVSLTLSSSSYAIGQASFLYPLTNKINTYAEELPCLPPVKVTLLLGAAEPGRQVMELLLSVSGVAPAW